jgi:hypothetical protein
MKVLIAVGGQSQQASLECRPFRNPIEFLFARSPAGTFRVYRRRLSASYSCTIPSTRFLVTLLSACLCSVCDVAISCGFEVIFWRFFHIPYSYRISCSGISDPPHVQWIRRTGEPRLETNTCHWYCCRSPWNTHLPIPPAPLNTPLPFSVIIEAIGK